uniref:Uncharacterized protein n=1 Tax=Timema bartmani TaxID=61472 RepID=A0A7R9I1V1_9NEOP|nr:unnamed protein product [Timema bartmani]
MLYHYESPHDNKGGCLSHSTVRRYYQPALFVMWEDFCLSCVLLSSFCVASLSACPLVSSGSSSSGALLELLASSHIIKSYAEVPHLSGK